MLARIKDWRRIEMQYTRCAHTFFSAITLSSWIALSQRARMIEATNWYPDLPRSFVGMAVRAGFATWVVIVAVTVFFGFESAVDSLKGLWSAAVAMREPDKVALWLPVRVATAVPWFLVGASFSVLLASRLDGDVRQVARSDRVRDAAVIGIGLMVFVVAASIIQDGLKTLDGGESPVQGESPWAAWVPILLAGMTGLLVGSVMGYMVPQAFRREIMRPARASARSALRDLMQRARQALGEGAEAWVFTRHEEDADIRITPAEALRSRSHATGVWTLLDKAAAEHRSSWQQSAANVIDGGRKAS